MKAEVRKTLDRMFNPRGVAVFGGMKKINSFGQMNVASLLAYGYIGKHKL